MTAPSRPPYGSRPGDAGRLPGAPIRLGHLVPERRPVVISRPNPDWMALTPEDPRRDELPEMVDVILQGYVAGETCPGVVKAELASIDEVYVRALNQAQETASADERVSTGAFLTAWHTYVRETIQALVPGLTPGEADVLAALPPNGVGPGADLLRYLEFWDEPPDPEAAGDAAGVTPASPADGPPSLIMGSSLPISPPSTESDPESS